MAHQHDGEYRHGNSDKHRKDDLQFWSSKHRAKRGNDNLGAGKGLCRNLSRCGGEGAAVGEIDLQLQLQWTLGNTFGRKRIQCNRVCVQRIVENGAFIRFDGDSLVGNLRCDVQMQMHNQIERHGSDVTDAVRCESKINREAMNKKG
jgi:hypothetical protein